MGEMVISIDLVKKEVVINSGRVELYDELILVMGFFFFIFLILGFDKKGVMVFWDIKDMDEML